MNTHLKSKVKALTLSLLSAASISLPAYCHTTIDSSQVLNVSVSNQGFTRISVEGESITEVIKYPSTIDDHVKASQGGHVIVIGDGLKEPVYLSLTTDRGTTQDLKVTASATKPKPIILKKLEVKRADTTPQILASFVRGIYPQDFTFMQSQESPWSVDALKITYQGSWVSQEGRVVLYEIENTGEQTVTLSADKLRRSQDQAVALTADQILPKGQVRYFVKQGAPNFKSKLMGPAVQSQTTTSSTSTQTQGQN